MITIVIIVIVIATLAIFSIQNAVPVTISFLFWRFEASLAIVILLSVLAGIIITIVFLSAVYIKRSVKKQD